MMGETIKGAYKPGIVEVATDRVLDRMGDHSDRANRQGFDRYEKVAGIFQHLGHSFLHRVSTKEWRQTHGIDVPTGPAMDAPSLTWNSDQIAAAKATPEWQAIAHLLSLSSTTH